MYSKKLHLVWSYLCVAIGSMILAFGAVVFLSKLELVSGGVSGIAIIIQHFVTLNGGGNVYDYVVAALMVFFWVIGLIFIGWKFSIRTLFSTLVYTGFTFLFNRVEFFNTLAMNFAGGETPVVGNYILCGVFGGVFVGGGVALTFLGGGSSGGVDVIQIILRKYCHIKESIGSFIVDGTIVVVGMLCMCITKPELLTPALCGILSSFVAAVLIEIVYIRNQTSYQVDIISDHWKEINEFAQKVLDRGTTIIKAEGGYKGDERIILRVVFDKSQYEKLKEFIAVVDPKAFITFTQTNAVYGEGFDSNKNTKKPKK